MFLLLTSIPTSSNQWKETFTISEGKKLSVLTCSRKVLVPVLFEYGVELPLYFKEPDFDINDEPYSDTLKLLGVTIMNNRQINSNTEVQIAVKKWFYKQPETFYCQGIYRLLNNGTHTLMLIKISIEFFNTKCVCNNSLFVSIVHYFFSIFFQ